MICPKAFAESVKRRYRFDAGRIAPDRAVGWIAVTRGQMEFEWKHLCRKLEARAPLAPELVREIRMLAASTDPGIREIHRKIGKRASRGRVGEITKQIRSAAR